VRATKNPSRRARLVVGATLVASLGGLAVGCGNDGDDDETRVPQDNVADTDSTTTTSSTTTTAPPTTESTTTTTEPPPPPPPPTTTTAPPPPPAPPAPPEDPAADGTLQQGDSGDAVLALQQRLVELGYWLGEPDGSYGHTTQQAVLAFQKAEGLDRDGVAGPQTQAQLPVAARVTAASAEGTLIEIDLARQLLFVVENGQVVWAFNTSTGASGTPTPPGTFSIDREIAGNRHAELGILYYPKYFNGGIAIHGYSSIPAYPASHGCTRVSKPAMDWLWASGYAQFVATVWVH
jgi:peptidoglycan hydrolase-like protein with peptidoglycan-binding domain